MDYDRTSIPSGYDRGRDHGPAVLALWMAYLASHLGEQATVQRILDLGCGTGRFSESLARHFDAAVIGVDPSRHMLEHAVAKRSLDMVAYVRAAGEAIPLSTGSVDIVFTSMTFHHFTDATVAARECHRVLRQGGSVFVRTGTREQIDAYPYVPFFPSSRSMLEETLPNSAAVTSAFEHAGFRLACSDVITQEIAPSYVAYADKLAAGGDSILTRLPAEELERGLAAIRKHPNGGAIVEPIDIFVFG